MRPLALLLLLFCVPLLAETGGSADASDDIELPANVSQLVTEERPAAPLSPSRCARCHEGESVAANLKLPFRPYDRLARQNWVLEQKAETVRAELAKLKRAVFDTPQMPPADSEEAKGFDRESEENKSLKSFLETELARTATGG